MIRIIGALNLIAMTEVCLTTI